jgi:hypothetical protein
MLFEKDWILLYFRMVSCQEEYLSEKEKFWRFSCISSIRDVSIQITNEKTYLFFIRRKHPVLLLCYELNTFYGYHTATSSELDGFLLFLSKAELRAKLFGLTIRPGKVVSILVTILIICVVLLQTNIINSQNFFLQ